MSAFDYKQSTITKYRKGTPDDPYIPITESKLVVNQQIVLSEIPVYEDRVLIAGMVEVQEIPLRGLESNQFYVDYNESIVHFHASKNSTTVNPSYRGKGNHFVSSSRVWTATDEAGNVTQTLQDIIEVGETAIVNLEQVNEAISNVDETVNEANQLLSALTTTMGEIVSGESVRNAAEQQRNTNETTRTLAETGRNNNESNRVSAETGRVTVESSRVSAESTRQTNETTRTNNENERIATENIRKANEITRGDNESQRLLKEEARIADEANRVTQELSRSQAENVRDGAEQLRNNAESERKTNESQRHSSEDVRENNETERQGQESTRQSQESSRQSQEALRQLQEENRQSQEEARENHTSEAISNVNDVVDNANNLIASFVALGEYSAASTYVTNNTVNYNGSTWRCISDATGIAPAEGVYWTLVAAKGVDGTGAGTVISVASSNGDLVIADGTVRPDIGINPTLKSTWDAKANTASPAFTGIPTAPTATNGTNTTQIATTEFVMNNASVAAKAGTGQNSVVMGINTMATGIGATAEGGNSTAQGNYSHAEGQSTVADAQSSHAEGDTTLASGKASHAEGSYTTASGVNAHAEGVDGIALGNASHAEGEGTRANGDNSHAEGMGSKANGPNSHAEGMYTEAGSFGSHAEGNGTRALGSYAHAEGYQATAYTSQAHAEGFATLGLTAELTAKITAFNSGSKTVTLDSVSGLSVGTDVVIKVNDNKVLDDTIAAINGLVVTLTTNTPDANCRYLLKKLSSAYPSHAEGQNTIASGLNAHAEGTNTVASSNSAHSEGRDSIASGVYSHAEGGGSIASGNSAHAEGANTQATGAYAHSEGSDSKATGTSSHAEGDHTTASGNYSHAGGYYGNASNTYAFAHGNLAVASGSSSTAFGAFSTASGYASVVMGDSCKATGDFSQALGNSAEARYAQMAIGLNNTISSGSNTAYAATNELFIIGNGTNPGARGNAFKVLGNGQTFADGAYASTGADYAEYLEWADGNPDNEDRVGFFVTLDGDKIRKATSSDDYILGIVSATPMVVGDNYEAWKDKYVTDKWGRVQYHWVDVPEVTQVIHHPEVRDEEDNVAQEAYDDTIVTTPAHQDYVQKLNPDWDPEQEYVSREKRPEWSPVGFMGKLLVYDNGECQVNGYCKPNDDGIAIPSSTPRDGVSYRVMKRVSEDVIQVLLK